MAGVTVKRFAGRHERAPGHDAPPTFIEPDHA